MASQHRRRHVRDGGVVGPGLQEQHAAAGILAKCPISEVSIPVLGQQTEVSQRQDSGPVGGPGGEVFVHRLSEVVECAVVWQQLPALAPIE